MYLSEGQQTPACLVQLLLIRAGIHPNPGPTPGTSHICPTCHKEVTWKSESVRCSLCNLWCHLRQKNNCSQIKESQYNINYVCPSCHMSSQQTAQPTPTNQHTHTQTIPSPPLPHHPHHPQADLQQTTDKSQRDYNLKILQFNCNGISGKITEIINCMI